MKFRDSTGPLLLGIAVFSASLMCLAPLCSGESSSKELEIKAIPTWDVKHDIGPSGPVTDLHCDVGDIEKANTVQLFGILDELANTTYFRLVSINLDGKCKFWGSGEGEKKCNSTVEGSEGRATKPKTQCSLDMSGGGPGKKKAASFSTPPPGLFGGFPGGPPGGGFPSFPMPTTDEADKTITSREEESLNVHKECNDTSLPEFWLDMCHNIPTNASDYLNLNLNPERWTGYNGSHVWKAIYEENCFEKLGEFDDMCYEERVLYRLLSGLHASTNIHISLEYFPPSKSAGRKNWEPNPERFIAQYGSHPERLKNLHFAFVVVLRAVRKAAPYLYNYPFSVGDSHEDELTSKLVQRLLDSHIMKSCSQVFEAFDETLMFRDGDEPSMHETLKRQFKGVFQNISSVMDCISCQKCKLHGKLQLLGLGTALKILLLPEQLISTSLSRNEIVAIFQALHKFSGAIKAIPQLSALYWSTQESYRMASPLTELTGLASANQSSTYAAPAAPPSWEGGATIPPPPPSEQLHLLEQGFKAVVGERERLGEGAEAAAVDALMTMDPAVLMLSKYYAATDPKRFAEHAARSASILTARVGMQQAGASIGAQEEPIYDAVVVGGGLAGLSAALTVLDRGGRVAVVEKMGHLGGNSAWASSGVNAVDLENNPTNDSIAIFTQDVLKGAQLESNPLVNVLTEGATDALFWLRSRLSEHLKLDLVGQMGGHSHPRTHRPTDGLAGSMMIYAIEKQLNKYLSEKSPRLLMMKWTKATRITVGPQGEVSGIEWERVKADKSGGGAMSGSIRSNNVVIATGGYASDYTEDSLLKKHRPDLLKYATTNTKGTTGDGHKMLEKVGAKAMDMDDVQVHPTGFVNPADTTNMVKTLCAEILRGEGGIILNRWGKRFVNELGTRDHVTAQMVKEDPDTLQFAILLNEASARKAETHIGLYTKKGLITRYETLDDLAKWSFWDKKATAKQLDSAFKQYDGEGKKGADSFGKKFFKNVPVAGAGPWYVGIVTPVIHYCMGGVAISPKGEVLREDGSAIKGLFAAGEVIGGLHGKNRLGGNALSECVVFGREIGKNLEILPAGSTGKIAAAAAAAPAAPPAKAEDRVIGWDEMGKHVTEESAWVALHGKVYDFTEFLDEHPAGVEAILKYAGKDGTEIYDAIHSMTMLDDFKPIGVIAAAA